MNMDSSLPLTLGPAVPEKIYFEVTNNCNLKCVMCPQGYNLVDNKGFLNSPLFTMVLSQIKKLDPIPRLGFHLTGEPLLHPETIGFVAEAHQRGIPTFMHTNGMLLDRDLARRLSDAGLDEITISFEGENPEFYEKIRRGGKWQTVKTNIESLLSLPIRPKLIIEVLKFRERDLDLGIKSEFREQFPGAEFHAYYASDWRGTLNRPELKEPRDTKEAIVCRLPLRDMAVGWDGRVKACTIDYNTEFVLGDLRSETLVDVWLGKQRVAFLKKIYGLSYSDVSLCCHCNAPYYAHKKNRLHLSN